MNKVDYKVCKYLRTSELSNIEFCSLDTVISETMYDGTKCVDHFLLSCIYIIPEFSKRICLSFKPDFEKIIKRSIKQNESK